MNLYFITAIIFVAFFIGILAYRIGLQDGLNINKGKDIKPIPNPVTATYKAVSEIKENSEQKKEEKEFNEHLNNLFSYDGTPQKKEDE
jgi:hypothetical protein